MFDKYLNRPNSLIPSEHQEILNSNNQLNTSEILKRDRINDLFKKGYLHGENGYLRNDDGSTYVSVLTKMPKVSVNMINWWFWWHANEAVRYQIWYPEMHFSVQADFQDKYLDDSLSYSQRLHLSTHLVTEDIGLGKDKILIDFMSPESFGFNKKNLSPENTIICARVGSPDKHVWATDMCHFVRTTESGVEMRSRFWIGYEVERISGFGKKILDKILNLSIVKSKLIPSSVGKAMFHHCSQEYHNLADILPSVYEEHHTS